MISFGPDKDAMAIPYDSEHPCLHFFASFGATFANGKVEKGTAMCPFTAAPSSSSVMYFSHS